MRNNIITKEYRADINGLRAVAVILVLLFHLDLIGFEAGFLGVDVFFVISGYLISKNILKDLQLGNFSFSRFYTRRFKRLFPALFFTLAISLFVGYLLLSPVNLERLGKSVLSGVLSISNFFFLSEKGYFDLESAYKPLLHIWSLSIEEQYYLVWPLLLFGIFKIFRKYFFIVILFLIASSLFLSHLYIDSPETTFYMLPFRFFEFLLGALVIWMERYLPKNNLLLELLLLAGLSLITFSAIHFNSLTPMPSLYSLVPTVGAMLVIYAGKAKYSSWLLKNRVFEIIGKSSYSIYLIHWPIIVYYKYWTFSELTNYNKGIIGALSLVLGYLMWKYIENTFRFSKIKFKKIDFIWIWMPSFILILSLIAYNIWYNKGYPSRYPKEFTMTREDILANRERYWNNTNSNLKYLKGTNDKNIIVMGSSHAVGLIYALRINGVEANIVALQTSHYCYNFGTPSKEEFIEPCEKRKKENLQNEHWATVDAIYLHDHWPKADVEDLKSFLLEVRKLSSAPIYILGPKMIFNKSVIEIAHLCPSSTPFVINKFAQDFSQEKQRIKINNTLIEFFKDDFYKENKMFFIDILKIQADEQKRFDIISTKDKMFLYFDGSHFTETGAAEFGEKLKRSYPNLFNITEL